MGLALSADYSPQPGFDMDRLLEDTYKDSAYSCVMALHQDRNSTPSRLRHDFPDYQLGQKHAPSILDLPHSIMLAKNTGFVLHHRYPPARLHSNDKHGNALDRGQNTPTHYHPHYNPHVQYPTRALPSKGPNVANFRVLHVGLLTVAVQHLNF